MLEAEAPKQLAEAAAPKAGAEPNAALDPNVGADPKPPGVPPTFGKYVIMN